MKRIERLWRESHKIWVEEIARALNREVSEGEKVELGRVPFEDAYKAGYRQALEDVTKRIYANCTKIGCACKHVDEIQALPDEEVQK